MPVAHASPVRAARVEQAAQGVPQAPLQAAGPQNQEDPRHPPASDCRRGHGQDGEAEEARPVLPAAQVRGQGLNGSAASCSMVNTHGSTHTHLLRNGRRRRGGAWCRVSARPLGALAVAWREPPASAGVAGPCVVIAVTAHFPIHCDNWLAASRRPRARRYVNKRHVAGSAMVRTAAVTRRASTTESCANAMSSARVAKCGCTSAPA